MTLVACYQMLPCVFNTKRHLSKEMNRVLYILHVPIHLASISFLRCYCVPGPEWGVEFPFYLFPIVNPNDHEFPFSLLRIHRTALGTTEMIFLVPGFSHFGLRASDVSNYAHRRLWTKGETCPANKLTFMREIQTEQSPRGGRRGGKQRETTSLQNPAHQERIWRNHKGWNEYFHQVNQAVSRRMGDGCQSLGPINFVAKPVLRAGHWAVFSLTSAHWRSPLWGHWSSGLHLPQWQEVSIWASNV